MSDKLSIVHIMNMVAHGSLSPDDLRAGGRGVTGSEQAMFYLSKAQAEQGHRVILYTHTDKPGFYDGVEVIDSRLAFPRFRRADAADVVISWISADPLRGVSPKALRVHSLQINDWFLCAWGYEKYVDLYVAASETHRLWLMAERNNPGPSAPWAVVPNGTDLSKFKASNPRDRKPLRCVYASSPDRGLHWLLSIWPEIRYAFPQAELHIFYEIEKWIREGVFLNSEVGIRAKYVFDRLRVWKDGQHGVYVRGAVSPEALAGELLSSDLMLYPCDTIRPTEGFGVSVLDACAAGVVPVITDVDAFGEIYANSGAVLVHRGDTRVWIDEFLNTAIALMRDREQLEERRLRVMEFAKGYDWRIVSNLWMREIQKHLEAKRC